MTPQDKNWHSFVEAAIKVDKIADIDWDHETDVLVVGLGGAGVACALQSLELGSSVIAVDKFEGGGATKASGGVIYAGGGTQIQKEAGVKDTPKNMFNYLKLEVGDIVSDACLKDFCDRSADTIDWMIGHNVDMRPTLWPHKTSFPGPTYFLYHSDNTLIPNYKAKAKPAARGHRGYAPFEQSKKATNLGGAFYHPLKASAVANGMTFMDYSEARQIVLDSKCKVIGLHVLQFDDPEQKENYIKLRNKAHNLMMKFPPIIPGSKFILKRAIKMLKKASKLEEGRKSIYIRAKKGVLLSSGGFVFNSKMLGHYAPKYMRAYPLGTDGDNGSGIRLGQTAGGAIGNMDRMTAWRFINPPLSFAKGLIVNQKGERFINEMVYGATLGVEMVENQDGEAWLILDKPLLKQALEDVSGDKALDFQRQLAQLNARFGTKKGKTIKALAEKIKVPADVLEAQITKYNTHGEDGSDPHHKTTDDIARIGSPPYIAINIGLSAKLFPCPALTLGGLKVDEKTGSVLNEKGKPVKGLYAAGRNAIGIASWNYLSGLSIADGIYSGRRAARSMGK
ncbi:MAG: FAD-binding protein [Hellea sp.]|nr:FAD-binding protein [Hellea sp.]